MERIDRDLKREVYEAAYLGRDFTDPSRFCVDAGLNLNEIDEIEFHSFSFGIHRIGNSESVALDISIDTGIVGTVIIGIAP